MRAAPDKQRQPVKAHQEPVSADGHEFGPGGSLARRPVQCAAADQVHVQMKHGLSSARAYIEHSAIAIFNGAVPSNPGRGQMAASHQFGVFGLSFLQAGDMFLGDDQNVCRTLWFRSSKAKVYSSSKTFLEGTSPRIMRQNKQSAMSPLPAARKNYPWAK